MTFVIKTRTLRIHKKLPRSYIDVALISLLEYNQSGFHDEERGFYGDLGKGQQLTPRPSIIRAAKLFPFWPEGDAGLRKLREKFDARSKLVRHRCL